MYRHFAAAFLIVFSFLLMTARASSQEALLQQVNPNPDVEILDDAISLYMRDFNVPGVALALYYNGAPHVYSYGYADLEQKKQVTGDTIFEIGSITKVFTGISLAWEVLSGRMATNDLIIKYIPGLENLKTKEMAEKVAKKGKDDKKDKQEQDISPITEVTLLQLATHSSSLPRVPPQKPKLPTAYTPERMAAWLKEWKPNTPIGTRYNYSNVGYGLLGYAISNHNGVPYEQLIKEEILDPLGMKSTFIKVPDALMGNYAKGYQKDDEVVPPSQQTNWPASGALRSTGQDMLQFLLANLGVKGTPPLFHAMAAAQKGFFRVNDSLVMGLGWQRYERNKDLVIVDKNGTLPGYSSYIGLVPAKKIGIVILSNKGGAETVTLGRALLERLAARKGDAGPTPAPVKRMGQ